MNEVKAVRLCPILSTPMDYTVHGILQARILEWVAIPSPGPQFKSIHSLALSLPNGKTLTFIHNYWKNHSFDYTDLSWQSDVSAF